MRGVSQKGVHPFCLIGKGKKMFELQDLGALEVALLFSNLLIGVILSLQDLSKRRVAMKLLYLKAGLLLFLSLKVFGAIALVFASAGLLAYLLFSRFLKADSLYLTSLFPLLASNYLIFLPVFCFCLVAILSTFLSKHKDVEEVAGIPFIFVLVELPYLFFIFF